MFVSFVLVSMVLLFGLPQYLSDPLTNVFVKWYSNDTCSGEAEVSDYVESGTCIADYLIPVYIPYDGGLYGFVYYDILVNCTNGSTSWEGYGSAWTYSMYQSSTSSTEIPETCTNQTLEIVTGWSLTLNLTLNLNLNLNLKLTK